MKRLVPAAAAVMLAGGFLALRPILFRETLTVALAGFRGTTSYESQVRIGIDLAFSERESRAGRFKVRTLEVDGGLFASHAASGTLHDFREGPDRRPVEFVAVLDTGLDLWALDTLSGAFPILSAESAYPLPDFVDSHDKPLFRIIPSVDRLGDAAARWSAGLGARRVFLLEEMFDDRSSTVANAFRRSPGVRRAGEIRFHQPYDSLAEEVLRAIPDAVFMAGEPRPHAKTREIFERLRAKGFAGELIFADADPAASLVVLAPVPFPEGTRLVSFLAPPPAGFAGRFGQAPPGAWYGYTAAKAALDAIEKAESKDSAAIRRALASLPIFAADGGPASPVLAGYTFKNGAWMFTETLK